MTPYTVDESVGNAVVTVVLNRPSPNPGNATVQHCGY